MLTLKTLTLVVTLIWFGLVAPQAQADPRLGLSIAWQRGDAWAQRSLDMLKPPA